jgi:hypothetical protein
MENSTRSLSNSFKERINRLKAKVKPTLTLNCQISGRGSPQINQEFIKRDTNRCKDNTH